MSTTITNTRGKRAEVDRPANGRVRLRLSDRHGQVVMQFSKADARELGQALIATAQEGRPLGMAGVTARKRFGHAGSREDQLTDRYARSAPRENRLASERVHTVVRRVPRSHSSPQSAFLERPPTRGSLRVYRD
jgi:hypothetical protein